MLGGINLMNKFYKVLGLGFLVAVFAVSSFAQEGKTELYNKYLNNYEKNDVASKQIALDAAKEYIAKYNTPDDKPQVDYFRDQAIPALEGAIEELKLKGVKDEELKAWNALLTKFDTAVRAKNWTNVFSSGKEIMDKQLKYVDAKSVQETKLNLGIVLSLIGYDRAVENAEAFSGDTLNFSKKALQSIEAGQTSDAFGAYTSYQCKTAEYPDGKSNCIGWLNYNIGYIMFYRQKNAKNALPYLYEAVQQKSQVKEFSDIYRMIGSYYLDEVARIDKERIDKVTANNNEDNEETLALLALEKGNADRGIDAYARAYKIAKDNPKATKEYRDGLYKVLNQLYTFRFGEEDKGLETYIAGIMSKPMPNPSTAVQPVVEQKTTVTTTTTTTTPTTPSTKPETTTKTSTVTTKTTVKPAETTETKTPPPAKKPRKRK